MADYYTKFSLIFTLPTEEAQQYALDIASQAEEARFTGMANPDLPPDFPEELKSLVDNWNFETEADVTEEGDHPALWLHTEDGGVESAIAFIQHLLKKFQIPGRVEFEWSNDCSKPRADAYGGGAAIVTATSTNVMSTCEWLLQNRPNV